MTLSEKEIAETMKQAIEWGKDGRLQASIERLIAKLENGEVSVQDVPPLAAWLQTDEKVTTSKLDLSGINDACR
jgi:hypothetical protein